MVRSETTSEPSDLIVVGVNGGPSGGIALCWALQQAKKTDATVRVVHAWHVPVRDQVVADLPDLDIVPSTLPPTPQLRQAEHEFQDKALFEAEQAAEAERAKAERRARRELDATIRAAVARTGIDDVHVEHLVLEGPASHVLPEAARGAQLLVLGCRGRNAFSEIVMGSVSRQCAHHAPCPVVIVPMSTAVCKGEPPKPAARQRRPAVRDAALR